jgi:translation initiation factor IF-3
MKQQKPLSYLLRLYNINITPLCSTPVAQNILNSRQQRLSTMVSVTTPNRRQLTTLACIVLLSSVNAFTIPSQRSVRAPVALFARKGGGRKRYAARVVEEDKPPMNNEIKDVELRVVTANASGKDDPLGLMSKAEALAMAKELGGLDLILINNNSVPPVCKIADYSKYRYIKEKKAKEVKKNSKASEVKEVKMSYKIDVHDYVVRKKNAAKFLGQGNRVKCTIVFRGREIQHDKLGFDLLDKLAVDLEKLALREGPPKKEGRMLAFILGPRPEVVKAVTDAKRAMDKAKKKAREASFEGSKEEEEAAAAAVAAANKEADDLLSALSIDITDETDVEDTDDDDDDSVESSLDALLGSDDLTDDLFS